MHIGLKVPNWGPLAGPDAMARTALAAEACGFDSLWVSDHVVLPGDAENYGTGLGPLTPFLDPLSSLAYVAALTTEVQLGTGVYVLPLRHALSVAKMAASVDVLSDGRLLLGVGAGWLRSEFELLGASWEDRGRRMDDAIATMRGCWSPGGGEARVEMRPRPRGDVPVFVGGHSDAALRRAARLGDGWYGSGLSPAELAVTVRRLEVLAEQAPVEGKVLVGARAADVAASDALDTVHSYEEAGADFLVLDTVAESVEDAVGWIESTAGALSLDPSSRTPLRSVRSWAVTDSRIAL